MDITWFARLFAWVCKVRPHVYGPWVPSNPSFVLGTHRRAYLAKRQCVRCGEYDQLRIRNVDQLPDGASWIEKAMS